MMSYNLRHIIYNLKTASVFQHRKSVVLSLCLVLGSFFSFAQVTSEIDTTKIRIGEQINYKIKVEADSTDLVVFPEGQTFMPLETVEALKIDTTKREATFLLSRVYKLTQFDSGIYTIPRQKVIIGEQAFFTDSLKVAVNTIEVDTTKQKLFDIKPIIEVEKDGNNRWQFILGLIIALALIAFILYWFIWRKKPLTKEEEIALLPPYDRAKLALQKLDESQYLMRSEVKEYYSELTFILRKYLDEKVYDRALESTTSELINRLNLLKDGNQIPLSKDTIKNIESILQRADLVKFAKSAPDKLLAEMDKTTIDKAIDHVKVSLPKPSEDEKLRDKKYKEEQERKKTRKKIWITVGIALFLMIATFVGFGIKYGFAYVKDTIIGHESKTLLEGEWVKSAYGFPPIYIETPQVLKREDVKLPEELKDKAKTTSFSYGSITDRLYVVSSTTILNTSEAEDKEEQKAININAVIEGNLRSWESNGVTNIVTKNDKFITPNKAEGVKTFGTAQFPGLKPDSFENGQYTLLSFTAENIIQQIVLVWRADDDYADEIIQRIIDSVELTPDEVVEKEN